MESKKVIITIDGPAGAGKSTVSKALADKLNYFSLDTGSMYRAITLKALRLKADMNNEEQLAALTQNSKVTYQLTVQGLRVLLDEEDVSEAIRTVEVTNNTSHIASKPKVREVIVQWQRKIGQQHNLVAEGRDMATVVFPNATYKFYLDADPNERVERRLKELQAKGHQIEYAKMKEELLARDKRDMTRAASPLKKADDAILVDCTGMSIDETAEEILKLMKKE